MNRSSEPPEEPGLFDLPLRPEASRPSPEPPPAPPSGAEQASIDLEIPALFPPDTGDHVPNEKDTTASQSARLQASLKGRIVSGLCDLGVVVLVGLFCFLGVQLLGVRAGSLRWPPFGVFLLCFSFLYHVFPLSFWGRTPGMAIAGLIARNADNLPLTIGQTGLRWIGALLTLAFVGLPVILAFTGASLTDRISRSRTFATPSVN